MRKQKTKEEMDLAASDVEHLSIFKMTDKAVRGSDTPSVPSTINCDKLVDVFAKAYKQVAYGKGRERHAMENCSFEDQQIVMLGVWQNSIDGAVFQGIKKALEAKRLPKDRAQAELLGAINYLAAAYITLDKLPA